MLNQNPPPSPGWSTAILNRLSATEAASPSLSSCPPISSIPRTSPSRLSQEDAVPSPFPSEPIPASSLSPGTTAPKTILYLAYGSNLCAETFLGIRGIRPLSQVNVSAPSLRLVFDLPGLPYREPCFANTAPRKIPKLPDPPKLPPNLPRPPTITPPAADVNNRAAEVQRMPGDPTWDKGLIGVVYEVTPEDFAHIVATEGGGAAYRDVLVPCLALPPRMAVPEKPAWPELPKMFVAHTLFAPQLPSVPGEDRDGHKETQTERGEGDGEDHDDDGKWKIPAWMKKLVLPVRRKQGDYAQPSARYLKLIRDGAREHELPDEYQRYLCELRPYTITTTRQRLGMVLLIILFGPVFLLFRTLAKFFSDDRGRAPGWVAVGMAVLMNLLWMCYDVVFKPLFGDGERTEEITDGWNRSRSLSLLGGLRNGVSVGDEEKRLLAQDDG